MKPPRPLKFNLEGQKTKSPIIADSAKSIRDTDDAMFDSGNRSTALLLWGLFYDITALCNVHRGYQNKNTIDLQFEYPAECGGHARQEKKGRLKIKFMHAPDPSYFFSGHFRFDYADSWHTHHHGLWKRFHGNRVSEVSVQKRIQKSAHLISSRKRDLNHSQQWWQMHTSDGLSQVKSNQHQ